MTINLGDRVKLKEDLFTYKAGTEGDIVSLQCPFTVNPLSGPRHVFGKGLYIHFDGVPEGFRGQCVEKKFLWIKRG